MTCRFLHNGWKRWGLCALAVLASLTSGCQVGRRWFQFDSDSRTPAMGIELRADAETDDEQRTDQPRAAAPREVLPVEHIEPERRRGLRDWFRLPRDEERVPLPTTDAGDDDDVLPATGPRPEFE